MAGCPEREARCDTPVMIARDRRVHFDRGPTQVRYAPWGDCKRSYWLRFLSPCPKFGIHSLLTFFANAGPRKRHTRLAILSYMSAHLHYCLGSVHSDCTFSCMCTPNTRLERVGEHLQPRAPTMINGSKSLGILGFLT